MHTRNLLSLCLLAVSGGAFAAPPAPAVFVASHGGPIQTEPVVVDDHVYVAGGPTLTVWSRAQPGAPVRVGDTRTQPTQGWLNGLVRRGEYLYASYRGYDSTTAGVAVYSIADRTAPVLLGQYGDYTNASIRFATGLALAGDKLLLLDSENGIFTGNLGDPTHPVFTQSYAGFGAFDDVTVAGDRLIATGRNFIDGTNLEVFDISNTASVQSIGFAGLDGFDNFRVKVKAPYAIGFGLAVNITDLSDPANIAPRGRVDSPVSYNGVLMGDYAWGVGGFDGIEVFNIADVDNPSHTGTPAIDTFSTDVTAVAGNEAWLTTRDDRLLRIDGANPALPALAGTGLLPGGVAPMDIAIKDDTALILGNTTGLHIADAATLAPVGRFVTSLPQSLQGRAFEQLAVDGNRAYLASWGTGLVIVDVSNPRAPAELAVWELAFATSVAARGNTAYVGTTTNGGQFVALDVTHPATPTPVGSWIPESGDKLMRIVLHGNYAFVAGEAAVGDGGGMFVLDVSNPASPTLVTTFTGCGSTHDLALDASGRLAAVAGSGGTCLVDVSNPAEPVNLGTWAGSPYAVALRGDRLYVGRDSDMQEVDIANRAKPSLVGTFPLTDSPRRIEAASDGRVYVTTGYSGVTVFKPDRLFSNSFE